MQGKFDVRAEEHLKAALHSAYSSANTNNGRYLSFRVQGPESSVTENRLFEYCTEWLPLTTDRPKYDTSGYRPLLAGEEDRSVVGLNIGGHQVYVQGRMETVMCLGPIAACFSLGIPPHIGRVLPSSAPFWDGLEKFRQIRDRPPTTVPISGSGKRDMAFWEMACQDDTAVTCRMISDYYSLVRSRGSVAWRQHAKKIWPDVFESKFSLAQEELILQPLDRFRPVDSERDADRLIEEQMEEMEKVKTNSWVCVEMAQMTRIRTGQFIWYMTQVWPDCVVTKCGTRWRPRVLPDGNDKGSMYLSSADSGATGSTTVCAIGKQYLLQALMPLMAACSLRIHPSVACRTASFTKFWQLVGSSGDLSRRLLNPFTEGSSCWSVGADLNPAWASPQDKAEWEEGGQFEYENQLCTRMLQICLHTFVGTNGFWSGGDALPGVSLSRKDFVDWILLWEPDAYVEAVGRFRVRPSCLEKGGISIERGGAYFAIQTSNEPAIAMLVILAAVMAGVAPEIAALCRYAVPFWTLVEKLQSGHSVVSRRESLRKLRDFKLSSGSSSSYQETREYKPSSGSSSSSSPVLFEPLSDDLRSSVRLRMTQFRLTQMRCLTLRLGAIDSRAIVEFEDRIKTLHNGQGPPEVFETIDSVHVSTLTFPRLQYSVSIQMDTLSREFTVSLTKAPNSQTLDQRGGSDLALLVTELFLIGKSRNLHGDIVGLVGEFICEDRK